MMVTGRDDFGFEASGCAAFPAHEDVLGPPTSHYIYLNPADWGKADKGGAGPFGTFEIWTHSHSEYDLEWPIAVSVPTALRGFRRSLGLSQKKLADALDVGRLNIERWETGVSRPYRGHTLTLMTLVKRLVVHPRSAGQFLNLAAAVVCPQMTRPTASYTTAQIRAMLRSGTDDHRYIAPALLHAFTQSEILVAVDPDDTPSNAKYISLVGARVADRRSAPWEHRVLAVAERLGHADRDLWLTIGDRLGRTR